MDNALFILSFDYILFTVNELSINKIRAGIFINR